MEHGGNLCIPCPSKEQPKGEFIIFSYTRLLHVCLMRQKHIAGNFNACVIANSEYL